MPSTEPTDRSTFRVITTIVSPSASSAIDGGVDQHELDVRAFRNRGWMAAVTATNTDQHGHDAGLADPEHPLGQPP